MIDLHLHLDGSLLPEDMLFLAALSRTTLPCDSAEDLRPMLQVEPDCRNLGEYLEKFDLPLQVLQTEQAISYGVYSTIKRLAADGLVYGEIRFAPQLHQAKGLSQQQVVAAAVDGLVKGISVFKIPAQLILCCMRGTDNQVANIETVRVAKEFLGNGVCAVDLAGNEAAFPTKDFAEVFGLANEGNIPFIIHAGEATGPESVWQAIELGAKRIGHGIRSFEDPALISVLKEKKIPLETCFTSNLQTKAIANQGSYPLPFYLEQGLIATVNTDNMTVSGTNLRREYNLLKAVFGLSENTLRRIAYNAADAAFLSPEQKDVLKNRIAESFSAWLADT